MCICVTAVHMYVCVCVHSLTCHIYIYIFVAPAYVEQSYRITCTGILASLCALFLQNCKICLLLVYKNYVWTESEIKINAFYYQLSAQNKCLFCSFI